MFACGAGVYLHDQRALHASQPVFSSDCGPSPLSAESQHQAELWANTGTQKMVDELVGVAQLFGHHPANPQVASLIPGQGTYLGSRFSTRSGPGEATD